MAAYKYTAMDKKGKESKGILDADNLRHASVILKEKNLIPIDIDISQGEDSSKSDKSFLSISLLNFNFLKKKITSLGLALVTRQLATLIKAGLPIDEALKAITQQTEQANIKNIIMGVRSKVVEGYSLASGLDEYPSVFPNIYRATVGSGEQAGKLDLVLERLAEYTESRHSLKQKISHALVYPIVLTIISLLIVILMLVYVVPKVIGVFESTGQTLPLLTRILIFLSNFLQDWWFLVIGFILLIYFSIKLILRSDKIKKNYHKILLSLPIIGKVNRNINTARFTRTLNILNSSGVPIIEAMTISSTVVTNLAMKEAVENAIIEVREGNPISKSLQKSKLFPAMSIHLISSGEASGELEIMLESATNHQESEVNSTITTMLSILEPALIIVMGAIVLMIVLAILLPIFEMNQLAI
ncbi:MAG: type II secretion system protein GspF [Gammaproteobacteria bacterium TMED78]|nr:MAG: type II secretion system protein GspF [Gammaproteobacteria bacterium TMED78]|tara:strand:+ start:56442 stop:57686 length:1245 start_codon:yes stop_codon:yes gene_type:complete